jgi:negative regulator of sigma-B (phosphoserine phosphatase)
MDWLEWGVACRPLPGQSVCGDVAVVRPFDRGVLTAAIDGLGHGAEAARASRTAADLLEQHPGEPLAALFRRCHEALRTTRGAVISLASFHGDTRSLEWVGVGNVEGLLLRAHADQGQKTAENIMLHAGLLGMNLPGIRPAVVPLLPGDTLILTTDGIRNDFPRKLVLSDRPQQVADRICARHAKDNDDALVLVVRYLG